MRMNKGFVLISVALVLLVLACVLWGVYVLDEAKTQHILQEAAQDLIKNGKPAQFPAPLTAAEVWAAQEQHAQTNNAIPPAGAAEERRPRTRQQLSPAPAGSMRFGVGDSREIPFPSAALLLTALAALGLAGSTYHLARQKGRIRLERDRLSEELSNVRIAEAPPFGGASPPWQNAALMMVRSSTVPAMAYDLDARVVEVSEAFSRITGYTRIDIPDVKSWFTKLLRTPDSELEAALESFRSKVHGGDIETQTIWTSSGEPRTWLCQPLEVWPLEGAALLLVARATDVTAQTEATRAARAQAESLRAALGEANQQAAAPVEPPPTSSREMQLAEQLARRDQECQQLVAQARTLNERLVAQQAEVAALRAHDTDLARRAKALAGQQQHAAVLLEAAYQAAGAGLCLLDANLKTLRANERWQEMTRGAAGVEAALAPRARDALRLRSGTRNALVQVRNDAGAERTWRLDCQPIAADNGAIIALAMTAEDITEQEARIAGLQEDAERFQLFAEQFEDSLWIADPRVPRLIYATAQASKLRARSLPRMMNDFSEWTAAVHEEDRERVRQAFAAAAIEGNYDVEYRVVREDRSIVWLHDRGIAVRDAQNRLRHLAGFTADVTVRKNAEDMTRRMLATLKTIVEHAPAMIWLKDAQGRYIYANREHERVMGYTGDQLRGKTDFQVLPRTLAQRIHENDASTLAANAARQFDETLQLADGLHHYIALKFPTRGAEASAGALGGIVVDVSERHRNEDALRCDESRYRAIAASLPEALLIARENRVIYANTAAAKLLGSADDSRLLGTPLQQLAASSEPGIVEAAKALGVEGAGPRRFATRLRARDGRELEVEASAAAYETATERAVQFVLQEVGERNARILALQQAEAFFHALCDTTPAALRLHDANGRCTFASRRWEALAGAFTGDDWFLQIHPDDRNGVRSSYAAPSMRDEAKCVEYRLLDSSGRDRWVLDTLLPRYDAQGQWEGYVSSAVDISARKRTEDALRTHRDELAALIDRCPAPVWVADAGGSGYANDACLAWLGANAAEKAGLDLHEYVHPEDRDAWLQARTRHMMEKVQFDGEFRLRRSDGEYRYTHIRAVPLRAAGESDMRCVGFLEDVTACREAAQALGIARQRHAQIVGLLGSAHGDGLAQVRHTAELVRLMFPGEAKLQQASAKVLAEAQSLENLVEEMLEPVRRQQQAPD